MRGVAQGFDKRDEFHAHFGQEFALEVRHILVHNFVVVAIAHVNERVAIFEFPLEEEKREPRIDLRAHAVQQVARCISALHFLLDDLVKLGHDGDQDGGNGLAASRRERIRSRVRTCKWQWWWRSGDPIGVSCLRRAAVVTWLPVSCAAAAMVIRVCRWSVGRSLVIVVARLWCEHARRAPVEHGWRPADTNVQVPTAHDTPPFHQ